MYAERHVVPVITDGAQAATEYSPHFTGRIHSITYLKTDFTDGVDFTITLEATGESLWTDTNINASETVYPVQKANLGGTGAASTILEQPFIAANDRVKIVIAAGGAVKTGAFHIVVG